MNHIGDGDARIMEIQPGLAIQFMPLLVRPEQVDEVDQPVMHRPVANYHIALNGAIQNQPNPPADLAIGEMNRPLDARERRAFQRERRAARALARQQAEQDRQEADGNPEDNDFPMIHRMPVPPRAANENRMLNMHRQMWHIEQQLQEGNASDTEEEEERRIMSHHDDSMDMLPVFVKRAHRDRAKKFQCPICHENIVNKNYMEHLKGCAEEKNVSYEEQEKAECMFKFSDYYFMEKLYALRERMELEYLDATIDPARRMQMACELCDTLNEHKNGKCMDNNQEAAFKAAANQIVQKAMSDILDFFEYKKQIALQKIADEYSDERMKLDIILTDQQDKAFADEMVKNAVRAESYAKDRVIFNMDDKKLDFSRSKQRYYTILVEQQTRRLVKYITKTKESHLLRTIFEYRKENNMNGLTEQRDNNFNKARTRGVRQYRRQRWHQPGRFLPV